MKSRHIIWGLAVAAVVATFVAWRLHASAEPKPSRHIAVLHDRSRSARGDCEALVGLVRHILLDTSLDENSTILVMGTGDSASANEPVEILRFNPPVRRRVMESQGKLLERREKLLQSLGEQCRSLPLSGTSAIALGANRAFEQLQSLGCRAKSACTLYLRTDGEETVESSIARALRGRTRRRFVPQEPLSHEGVSIRICDLARTVGTDDPHRRRYSRPRTSARARMICDVWTAVLGGPRGLTCEPLCPQAQTTKGLR